MLDWIWKRKNKLGSVSEAYFRTPTLAAMPPDLEILVYREISGEELRWWGRSSGLLERVQGWLTFAVGLILVVVTSGGLLVSLAELSQLTEGEIDADIWTILSTLSGILFFGLAVWLAWLGWRMARSAQKIVWAITNRRLLRMVPNTDQKTHSWTRSQIVHFEIQNLGQEGKEVLAVTVAGNRDNDTTMFIHGPEDLNLALDALENLE